MNDYTIYYRYEENTNLEACFITDCPDQWVAIERALEELEKDDWVIASLHIVGWEKEL